MLAFLIANPLEHIVRHPMIQRNGFTLLDSHIVMLMLAAVLLIALLPIWVRRRRGTDEVGALVPAGAGNAIEAICEYLRNEVARPNLHQYTDRFIKFIWTVFFFVFAVNLLGLLPLSGIKLFGAHIGGAATANPWITGALVLVTLGMVVVNGFRLGGKHFVAHFSPGPIWLSWLLIPIEIIGFFSRFFALLIRLCANMIAGHVLLAVLVSFILSAGVKSIATGLGVAVPVVLGSVAITLLELFVALLHAFIFTFLTTLFIGQAVIFHHDSHGAAEAH